MNLIDMPHHISRNHPQLSMAQRAAQFAPFAALTGFEDQLAKTKKSREKSSLDAERGRNLEYWDYPE